MPVGTPFTTTGPLHELMGLEAKTQQLHNLNMPQTPSAFMGVEIKKEKKKL